MTKLEIDLDVYRSEGELLAALRHGNVDACTCLVKRFAALVYKPVLSILQDADEADDVVQETFIKACDKFDSFEERSGLGSWLYRIATNEALMRKRRQQNAPQMVLPMDDTTSLVETISSEKPGVPSDDPATAALSAELRDMLARALVELPESLRQVFILRDMHGLSTEETAEALGLGESAVKVRLHRARKRLRDLLAGYLAAEPDN